MAADRRRDFHLAKKNSKENGAMGRGESLSRIDGAAVQAYIPTLSATVYSPRIHSLPSQS